MKGSLTMKAMVGSLTVGNFIFRNRSFTQYNYNNRFVFLYFSVSIHVFFRLGGSNFRLPAVNERSITPHVFVTFSACVVN